MTPEAQEALRLALLITVRLKRLDLIDELWPQLTQADHLLLLRTALQNRWWEGLASLVPRSSEATQALTTSDRTYAAGHLGAFPEAVNALLGRPEEYRDTALN